jgi:2-polyprenyl-3-methyl-5-hydroxy-6-metoxy-1,4-benzoquinol methylase
MGNASWVHPWQDGRCIVCGGTSAHTLFRPRLSPGPVVRCGDCGLVYVYPVEHIEWFYYDGKPSRELSPEERAEEEWHLSRYLGEEEWKRQNLAGVLDEIEVLHPRGRLLDLGCYCGLLLDLARTRGWDANGVEPEEAGRRYAVEHLGLNVFGGTLGQAAFPPDTFDVVVSLQVLEHLLDPRETLYQITRVLKPGGLLVVEVPSIDNLGFRLLGRWHRHFARHHLFFFSRQTLTRLLTEAGYQVKQVVYPSRQLSLRHLAGQVGGVDTPLSARLRRWVERLGLGTATISINLKDILRVYAVKVGTSQGGKDEAIHLVMP